MTGEGRLYECERHGQSCVAPTVLAEILANHVPSAYALG